LGINLDSNYNWQTYLYKFNKNILRAIYWTTWRPFFMRLSCYWSWISS